MARLSVWTLIAVSWAAWPVRAPGQDLQGTVEGGRLVVNNWDLDTVYLLGLEIRSPSGQLELVDRTPFLFALTDTEHQVTLGTLPGPTFQGFPLQSGESLRTGVLFHGTSSQVWELEGSWGGLEPRSIRFCGLCPEPGGAPGVVVAFAFAWDGYRRRRRRASRRGPQAP